MYFIRTEETIEDAKEALQRGRSVRRWAFAGATPFDHLAHGVSTEERLEALRELGFDPADESEAQDILLSEDIPDEDIIRVLNLEPFRDGWAQYLDGMCALQSFESEPAKDGEYDTLHGTLFPFLVCYEGEFVGYDPDEDWELFRPTRIVWVRETGSDARREFVV